MACLLTFLVTDLVGSTEILTRLGEARAESLQRTYFGLLRGAITSTAGEEVKSFGDGVMATFAGPSDAVACAVAMQRALARHNLRGGERLDVRIGIQVGEVIGEPEQLERKEHFGGPAVCAKRLCDAALGGQILVSSLVAALAEPVSAHSFEPLGLRQLKGFPEPMATFEVVYDRSPGLRPPLPPELARIPQKRSEFVGRQVELERLREIWQGAKTGERQLAFVAGEPGIGKTRLVGEFALESYGKGATVLWGRSFKEALVPYQPFVQALHHYVMTCDPDELRSQLGLAAGSLARLLPDVDARLPGVAPPPREEPESERYRLFETTTAFLAEISSTAPLLLVLDDLQWADQATLLLLRHLAIDSRPTAVLVIGTYRDTEVSRSHPLAQLQADVGRDRLFERIRLSGLPDEDVATLVGSLTGLSLPEDVTRSLQSETEGNPFFVEEVVRHLEELGAISDPERLGSIGQTVQDLGVPTRVKELVARRLQRLSAPALEALAVASVIGTEFGIDVLGAVLGDEDEDRLVGLLDDAVEARVVVEAPERIGRYGFSHALIQQALYEDHTANRRASLHARIAEAIERLHPDPQPYLAELTHHFARSGERAAAKVLAYARAAGGQALALLAYEDAAREFERALQALAAVEPGNRDARAELLVLLGTAQTRAGDGPAARASFREAAEIATEVVAADTLARAALGYGGTAGFGGTWVTFAAVDELLVRFLDEALRLCPEGDNPIRVRLLGRLAQALYWSPEDERPDALSREALESARRLGDPTALAYALDSRRVALWGPDYLDERGPLAEEMLRLGEELGDRDIQLEAYAWLITDALEYGSIDVVDGYIAAYDRVAGELRQPYHLWYAKAILAMRAYMEGRYADTARLAEEAWSHGKRAHGENALQTYQGQTLLLRRELAQLDGVIDDLEAYVATAPFSGWRAVLALVYAELGRREEARAQLGTFPADKAAALPRDCVWLGTLGMLAQVVGRLDSEEHAHALYELLLPFAERNCVVGAAVLCLGPVSRFLGILARVSKDHDRALDHLEHALERSRALRSPPLVTRTQAEMAKALLARQGDGDAARARALLDEARETADELGMARLAQDTAEWQAEEKRSHAEALR